MKMVMDLARNWWSHSKTVTLIWAICFLLFYCFFLISYHDFSLSSSPSSSSDSSLSDAEKRTRLYEKMARDLDEHGAVFLKHGKTSQSLSLSDIFSLKNGAVTPVHKAANPPVRANVLYLSPEYSVPISKAVKQIFQPYFDKVIWFQNSTLYHFSMFHASHHIAPVPASENEIEAEASSVTAVAEDLCPLKIVLDRVVLTSTGVLLGCWQVIAGTDPISIRAKLRTALPRAPEKQLYDAAILHTSFARILGHPNTLLTKSNRSSNLLKFLHELVARLNNQLHGFSATVFDLWYVEEYDVLALALDGRMKVRRFQLGCSTTKDPELRKHN